MDIIKWDIALFEYINNDLSNGFFDLVLPWLREPLFWVPFYIFLIAFVFFNYGKRAYWFVLFVILTAASSDLISSRAIKKNIKRIRPCNTEMIQTVERVRCGSGYSFTSSHAANHFAVATFIIMTLGQFRPKINKWLWLWAASIGLAQVYVGVHFPLDVFAGAVLGVILGKFWSLLFHKYYGLVLDKEMIAT
ncbi:MAG TPA: phosphatase PAP2 family protein [Saprospiraceae bacterium]|nr:phosphatase PAP2 family protein [Saprospiraceae bacterium]